MNTRARALPWIGTLLVLSSGCSDEPAPSNPAPGGGNTGATAGRSSSSAGGAGQGGRDEARAESNAGGAPLGGSTAAGRFGSDGGGPLGGGTSGGTAGSSGAPALGGAGSAALAGASGAPSVGGSSAGGSAAGAGTGGDSGPWPPSATYSNPILWHDLADAEVLRVGDTYYYTASNMHYSPGGPILRSYDLVNWEYAGHAIPVLDFAPKYDLNGGHAYVKGTWASTLQYRKSNETFYYVACIEFGKTYVYTAPTVEGPWQKHLPIDNCYYDAGMLVDDDDKLYVAYGNTEIRLAELSADGLSQVRTQQVYSSPDMTLEGARFFKRDGNYYILLTRPADGQFVLRASSPWGPYTRRPLIDRNAAPVMGGGVPHQGGFVETQAGDWYYMAFIDAYPGGRIPALAPVSWSADGWPSVQLVNGAWGASYPYPTVPRPPRAVKPHVGTKTFEGPRLGHEWEWNHNPDDSKWSFEGGLRLQTATITTDLYRARNTLTHRILGPQSTGTIELDVSGMVDGDIAGLALLRQRSAYVAVKKSSSGREIVVVGGVTMDSNWNTTSTGTTEASAPLAGDRVWLRLSADIRPGANRQGRFSYSTDGTTFTPIGPAQTMDNSWQFFMGYRYGIFNFATTTAGGHVTVKSFTLTTP